MVLKVAVVNTCNGVLQFCQLSFSSLLLVHVRGTYFPFVLQYIYVVYAVIRHKVLDLELGVLLPTQQ